MTAEEVAELNKLAKEQEDKIMAFEQDLMIQSGIELVQLEIAKKKEKIENLKKEISTIENDMTSYQARLKTLLDTKIKYEEKRLLIDLTIKEANG
jgi:chromosome segregation ATPase